MTHFNTSFLQFFKDLAKNNSKEWFDHNRKTYEKEVKKPFADFVGVMIEHIQKYEPRLQLKPSDAIMRINRDIRFSKDKTPYNTYAGANISIYGKKNKSYPSFAFQLSPEEIVVYGGIYMLESDTLKNIRNYIASNLKDFNNAYNDKQFKEKFGFIQGERHKRVPTEYQETLAKEPLIANKQFYYSATLNPDIITSDKLDEILIEYYTAGQKVDRFLKSAYENKMSE